MTWKIDWWKDGIHILLAKKTDLASKENITIQKLLWIQEGRTNHMKWATQPLEPWFRSLDVSLLEEIMRTEFVIWCLTNDLAT